MISGQAQVGIRTPAIQLDGDGIPLQPPTLSVGLFTSEGDLVHCEAMGNDQTVQVVYTIENNALGRVAVYAKAFAQAGCVGSESPQSEETAYYFFMPPLTPELHTP